MTVKLKTMKTGDMDLQDSEAQNFLSTVYGETSQGEVDQSRTIITTQQKLKYIMHIFLLIAIHIFCFWYIPIHGNIKLYGSAQCNLEQEKYYGCKNFSRNKILKHFYIITCGYMMLSSLQLRMGFPIYKIASSILANSTDLGQIYCQIFNAIPLAVETRGLLDFTFSKTSLDIFQFWQLWQYHYDFFNARKGNRFYSNKILGSPMRPIDKCIWGVLLTMVVVILLVGPLWFFSDIGGFVAPNPVEAANFEISVIIEKVLKDLTKEDKKYTKKENLDNNTISLD